MKRVISGYKAVFMAALISAFMAGCGGGGGGSTTSTTTQAERLSGVAAAGLPVVGYVYLKDSAGHTQGPNPISSDGSFSFDLTGLTAPFYLRARGSVAGTSYDLYSAATSSGTANINPLTNLAVAAAARVSDPSSVYNNQTPITQANLNQAVTDIQTMLAPLLTAYNANINPITGAYTADHTGLDAVFDVVKVNIDTTTGSVAVVNAANTTVASGTTTTLSTATPVTQTQVTSTQTITTDLQAIQTMLGQYRTVLNKGASLTAADLDPLFATATTYGINDGFGRTQTINNQVSKPFTGKTITSANLTIEAMGADYKVDGVAYFSDGSFGFWEGGLIVTKESGSWKFKGNGYKSSLQLRAHTERRINVDSTVQTESGLHFEVKDEGNLGLQSAKLTGPGLPAAGITFSKPANEPVWLYLDALYQNSTLNSPHLYVMSDATIGSIPDNSIYTFEFHNANNGVIETRTRKISKRPFMASELTSGHFPTIGGITSHSISAANIGGTLSFTYTKPTAFVTAWLDAHLSVWGNSGSAEYDSNLLLNQTSGGIISGMPTSWTPTQAAFYLEAQDEFRRDIWLRWEFR